MKTENFYTFLGSFPPGFGSSFYFSLVQFVKMKANLTKHNGAKEQMLWIKTGKAPFQLGRLGAYTSHSTQAVRHHVSGTPTAAVPSALLRN